MQKRDEVATEPIGEPSLEEVRALATQQVEKASLRLVAPQIGITRGALHGLIRGRKPQSRTWDTLKAWYARAGGSTNLVVDDAYRTVPVSALRAWILARLEHEGYREIGQDVGLHHSTIEAFVKRVERPGIRIRRALAVRYLEDRAVHRTGRPSPYSTKVSVGTD